MANPVQFPLIEGVHFPKEIDKTVGCFFFLTIPKHLFKGVPCRLGDIRDTEILGIKSISNLFGWLVLLKNGFFELDDDGKDKKPSNYFEVDGVRVRRFHVYMEYLLPEGVSYTGKEGFELAVGIRFIFHIVDSSVNLHEAFKRLVEYNCKCAKKCRNLPHNKKQLRRVEDRDDCGIPHSYTSPEVLHSITSVQILLEDWMYYTTDIDETPEAEDEIDAYIEDDSIAETSAASVRSVFSLEKSCLVGMDERQRICPGVYPGLVFDMSEMIFPEVFMGLVLPKSTKWQKLSKNHLKLTKDMLKKGRIPAPEESKRLDALKMCKDSLQGQIDVLDKALNEGKIDRPAYFVRKKPIIDTYARQVVRVLLDGSGVSPEIHAIVHRLHKEDWENMHLPQRDFGKNLSFIGNVIAGWYTDLEGTLGVSTLHNEQLIAQLCCFDAYRQENNLHANFLLSGGASKGKSYTLQSLNMLMIPGTVTFTSHITHKAFTVDGDQDDRILLIEEAEDHTIGRDTKNGAESGDVLMKNMLTTCTMVSNGISVKEDKRDGVKTVSSQIGIFGCCTNEATHKLGEAMRSRYIVLEVSTYDRPGNDPDDKMDEARIKKNGTTLNDQTFVDRMQRRQALVAVVNKLIYTGVLPDVDIATHSKIIKVLVQNLKKEYMLNGIDTMTRLRAFMTMLARSLTIVMAIEKVFSKKAATTRKFDCMQLLEVQKYLVCPLEVTVFTFTLLCDQFIKVNHVNFICRAIYAYSNDFVKTADGWSVENGYYKTNTSRHITLVNLMDAVFMAGKHTDHLSIARTNLQTSFAELTKSAIGGIPVIRLDNNGVLCISKNYVEIMTEYSDGVPRPKETLKETVQRLFRSVYSASRDSARTEFITAIAAHRDHPFILETISAVNTGKKFAVCRANAGLSHIGVEDVYEEDIERVEFSCIQYNRGMEINPDDLDEFYSRTDDAIDQKINFEDYTTDYLKHMRRFENVKNVRAILKSTDQPNTISSVPNELEMTELTERLSELESERTDEKRRRQD